ncbi:hypothetical protein ACIQ1D_14725 [Lysinibacillus xylanilyticus]|uniref:hypothetical protein n=1 Tax=Lysinibacillus xylanilyticus TaxID=582475 RepID=UPI003824039A
MRNNKIFGAVVIFVLVVFGISYYFIAKSQYDLAEEFNYFPMPKNATLTEETELGRRYNWSAVSGENGIPLTYRLIIATNGWKAIETDGNVSIYKKDNIKIKITFSTDELGIFKKP